MEVKNIIIENFKTIKYTKLTYTEGIWEIIGDNQDSDYDSNGAGKSTLLEAIQQCLFNRTTLNVPIEDVGRKALGTSNKTHNYRLTAEFSKDGHIYKVINDRAMMKITIYKNNIDLGLKSIPQALKRIQLIVGMDINTFITLTFITHSTIGDLLENFSSSSLMKIILDFNQITALDKSMKLELKLLNGNISSLTHRIKSVEDSLEILGKYKEIDTTSMHRKKATISSNISHNNDVERDLRETIQIYNSQLAARKTLDRRMAALNDGLCITCGQPIDTEEEAKLISYDLSVITKKIDAVDVNAIMKKLVGITTSQKENQISLQQVSAQIIAAETTNQIYEENKEQSEDLRRLLINVRTDRIGKLLDSDILTTAIAAIKKGDLHRHLMTSFVSVLNRYLDQFRSFVNLPYVAISAEANKANVGFILHDTRFSQNIHLNTLSGGERTRLRLILLLAMLATIKDMTGASSNLLIFDESLDTLDTSASQDLAQLFAYLITHNNKFIALISHGQQLKDIEFSGRLMVTKLDGIATMTKETYD